MDIPRRVFDDVASKFRIGGRVTEIVPMTSGNINRTFMVTAEDNVVVDTYVFQRINTFVFKQPEYIMSNINHVTGFIADKIEKRTRPLEHREPIEKALEKGLDNALLICYGSTIKSLVDRDLKICYQTIEIYNNLLNKLDPKVK